MTEKSCKQTSAEPRRREREGTRRDGHVWRERDRDRDMLNRLMLQREGREIEIEIVRE